MRALSMRVGLMALALGGQIGGALAADSASTAAAASTTSQAKSYWLAAADGGVFSFGTAAFYGSMGGRPLNAPIVGMAAGPNNGGYWLVGADGGVFAFGDALYHGSLPGDGIHVNDIVGMAATSTGGGYWLVGADGGVFAFGNATYEGSLPGDGVTPAAPIVGIAVDLTGDGYYLAGSDGGVFAFGSAPYYGSFVSWRWYESTPAVVNFQYPLRAWYYATQTTPPSGTYYFATGSDGERASRTGGYPQPNTDVNPPPKIALDGPVVASSANLLLTGRGEVVALGDSANGGVTAQDLGMTGQQLDAPTVAVVSFQA